MPGFYAFILIVFFAAPLYADPEVSVRYENYPIHGGSMEEVMESMELNAPPELEGHFARTKWNVIWEYKLGGMEGEGCLITGSNVKLDVTFFMPEWREASSSDGKTRKKWEKFVNRLQRHEDGHMRIGLEAARGVEKVLSGMGTKKNCQEIKQLANQKADALISSKKQEEISYDKRTRHGRWQGAMLQHKKNNEKGGS